MSKEFIKDDFIEEVLHTSEEIEEVCEKIGKQISEDYKDKKPVLIGLLKGSIPFMAELMKHIKCEMETEYMKASSYVGTHSTGAVTIHQDVSIDVKGRHVIIVEDIIDTGLTMQNVVNLLKDRGVASVEIASLLVKPEGKRVDFQEAKYVGFVIENKFVVGYGLDYDQLYRNLNYIGVLKRSVYEK